MKISVGYKVVDGPWGGGNSFFAGLIRYLKNAGHMIVQDLRDDDIDVILLTDPRRWNKSIPYTYNAAWRYARYRNPNCLIVHRINECDERKNTHFMNRILKKCNAVADHTVFVGSWLRDLDLWVREPSKPHSIILNGSDPEIYNRNGFVPWSGQGPLKLVTHHWGRNWMKGFDIYQRLDQMLEEPTWEGRIEFTYVGNVPRDFQFRNATLITPKSGKSLADELRGHHAYVTGSINEPGGNHQNEGAQCGLPVLYLRSGCMPEYLGQYGIGYGDVTSFNTALETLYFNYDYWQKRIVEFPNNLDDTCARWENLFQQLLKGRSEILAARSLRESDWKLWRVILAGYNYLRG